MMKAHGILILALPAAIWLAPLDAQPAEPQPGSAATETAGDDSFPEVTEVLQGRTFATRSERDIFFLKAVHDRYPAHWPDLVKANITVDDYVWAPEKLERFIEELGAAMAGINDLPSSTNLAAIACDPAFYANTNTSRPGILRRAARVLMEIGPAGRQALAAAFNEEHYRRSPETLEELAAVIGTASVSDPKLATALGAAAFTFATTNGGTYPRCTEEAARNLLRLPEGVRLVAAHLNTNELFDNPGRFQAVVDGIGEAKAAELATNLVALEQQVSLKLGTLTNHPGAYRDDLDSLKQRVGNTLKQLQADSTRSAK